MPTSKHNLERLNDEKIMKPKRSLVSRDCQNKKDCKTLTAGKAASRFRSDVINKFTLFIASHYQKAKWAIFDVIIASLKHIFQLI